MILSKKLKKANQLLEEIAKKNKYITPVTVEDFDLFQKFFKKEPHTYGNSWTYVTQGVYGIGPNKLGYKYFDGKNLSMVCIYPKIEKPDLNCFYWIRPMGPTILDIISDFSSNLLKEKGIPTYVKKIFKKQLDYLKKKGFFDTKDFPWHSTCHSEDDTYPEIIFDPKITLDYLSNANRKKNIKKSYKKAQNIIQDKSITFEDTNFEDTSWSIINKFFSKSNLKKINKIIISTKYDYHNPIYSSNSKENLTKKIVFIDKKPVGFIILNNIDKNHLCIYSLIILRNIISYLSDLIIFYIMENNSDKLINIGGSEDLGINNFKLKFKPIKTQKMYWSTNYRLE